MTKPEKYRQRIDEVEAMLWDGSIAGALDIVTWAAGTAYADENALSITNSQGKWVVFPGEYVVKGRDGQFRRMRADVFDSKYVQANFEGKGDQSNG